MTLPQAAFRGHYERMLSGEAKGEIQWQRAASNTMKILKKAGVSQAEAVDAATLIQVSNPLLDLPRVFPLTDADSTFYSARSPSFFFSISLYSFLYYTVCLSRLLYQKKPEDEVG